jgi:transposase
MALLLEEHQNAHAGRTYQPLGKGHTIWLFAGHDAAAANHARLWSLIASAERHHIDPQRYLTSVLAKIGRTPDAALVQFLPDVWKRDDAAEPLASET